MLEIIISDILNDPTFFKEGGKGVMVLVFMYHISSRSEKKLSKVIESLKKQAILDYKKASKRAEERTKLCISQVKNVVHDELKEVKNEAKVEYSHLLRNIKSLPKLMGNIILSDKKDVKDNVKKADDAINDCLRIVE